MIERLAATTRRFDEDLEVVDVRALPDDDYDLAPRTLGDLGDADLGPLLLAWGLAKAAVMRAGTDT